MIRIRKRPAAPCALSSEEVRETQMKIEKMVSEGNYPSSKDFPSHWLGEVRHELWLHQHGKCCYCERKRDETREPDIEHFRPKTEIKEVGKPGYWWLAYEWDNLFFSCRRCNQEKGSKFPIQKGGKRATKPGDDLSDEHAILLHPIDEDPEDSIGYVWENLPAPTAMPVKKDVEGRASKTIEILALERSELAEERGQLLNTLQPLAGMMNYLLLAEGKEAQREKTAQKIRVETEADKPHAGFKRTFFRSNGLEDYVSSD